MSEIVFELSASQYELMGYPVLRQGHSLDLILDAGLLFPEVDAPNWYKVRPEPLTPCLSHVARGRYAFAGQIQEDELEKVDGGEEAILLGDCGDVSGSVGCSAQADGALPLRT